MFQKLRHFGCQKGDVYIPNITECPPAALGMVPYSQTQRGFPGGASGKESACQRGRRERAGLNPQVGKTPWKRAWQPAPVFFPGESHGQRSLEGCGPQGRTESDRTEVTQRTHNQAQNYFFSQTHPPSRVMIDGVLTVHSGFTANALNSTDK